MFGKNPVPVFIINGFLEGGKTTFGHFLSFIG